MNQRLIGPLSVLGLLLCGVPTATPAAAGVVGGGTMKYCVAADGTVLRECVRQEPRSQAATAPPRNGQTPTWHIEVAYTANARTGCPDGFLQKIWRVYPDGTRELVYGGCPVANDSTLLKAPPAPAEVVQQAPIPKGGIGLNPKVHGLCGLETRYWYDGSTAMAPFTTTLNGYSVTASLHIVGFDWTFDDDGAHQSSADAGSDEHPSATHTYAVKGVKHVAVTITWAGSYTFQGPDGVLGTGMLQTTTGATRDYQVDEIQPVITNGPDN